MHREYGDDGGFVDHGADCGMDMAMVNIAGLFLLDVAEEGFASCVGIISLNRR